MEHSFQVGIVGLGVDRPSAGQEFLLLETQRNLDLLGDRLRDLALQGQNALNLPVVAIGPEIGLGRCLYELRRDSDPVSLSHHRALDHRVHIELCGSLRDRLL